MRSPITFLFLSLLLAVHTPAAAQQNERTLLWRITGGGMPRPSYLFGTVHMRAKKLFNFPDSLYTAMDNTELFALEINPDSMNNMIMEYVGRVVNKTEKDADKRKEKTLKEILTPAELRTLRENLQQNGDTDLDELTMKQVYLMKDRLVKSKSRKDDLPVFMDAYLYTIAKDKGKIVAGVERPEDQMSLLEKMDMTDVNHEKVVNYFKGASSVQDDIVQLYIDRDLEGLQRISDILPEKQEEEMLTLRNFKMVRNMDSIMHGHSLFCAVGALHLPGKRGLISLLKEKGYIVEPVICNSYTNGADYDFRSEGQNWLEVTSDKDGYAVKMPGQPNDINANGGTVVMKMYYDLTTSRSFMLSHVARTDNAVSSGDVMDEMSKRITKGAKNVQVTPVSNGTLRGKDYIFTSESGLRYHMQIIGNGSDIYMLGVYAQSADVRHVDSFFNTFRTIPKAASGRVFKTFDDIRLSVSLPDCKPSRAIRYSQDSSSSQIAYTIVDPTMGSYYFVVCDRISEGYNFNDDTVLLHHVKTKCDEQDIAVNVEALRFSGFNAYYLQTEPFKSMRIKTALIFCGNRQYNLTVQFPDNEKGRAGADSFIHSVRISPPVLSQVKELKPVDGSFSTFVPAPIIEDTAGKSSLDTTQPFTRVYKSFDTSVLLTYYVSVKRLSHYYWKSEDTLMLKNWLKRDLLKTDSTPVFAYYHANGLSCGEAVAYKRHSEKVHRLKVIADGRTRYMLDCTYPLSFQNDKRIDSFYARFTILRNDPESMKPSPRELFTDLHSADSATRNEAEGSINEVYFSKNDVPVLLKELSNYFPDDRDTVHPHITVTRLFNLLKDYATEIPLARLDTLYSDPMVAERKLQFQVLGMMADQNDSVPAYRKIKQLLLSSPPRGGNSYVLREKLKMQPVMAKSLYPELLSQCADSILGNMVCGLTSVMLKDSILSREDINSYIPLIVDKSKNLRGRKETFFNTAMLYLLSELGTKETWEEVRKYQFLPTPYLRYTAVRILVDSMRQPDISVLDSIAANRDYRLALYYKLTEKNIKNLFPLKYITPQYFAESYLASADDDGYYDHYTQLGVKTVMYKGERQKFYLYKVEETDDNKALHLGVAGPFSSDSKNFTIDEEDNACGFLADAPDMGGLENQLKLYLIKRKISASRQE